jgi:hypothetical protein
MPTPFNPLSLPIISELVGSVGQTSAQLLFPQASSWTAYSQQKEASRSPFALPPPDAMINALLKGYFTLDKDGEPFNGLGYFLNVMRRHGVFVGAGDISVPGDDPDWVNDLFASWDRVIDSQTARPGMKEAITAYIAGLLPEKQFKIMMQRGGAWADDWKWFIPLMCQRLTIDQVQEAWHRGLMSEAEFDAYAKMLQFGIPGDIQKLKDMSMIIPGPQDMIRLVVRDTFNPRLVTALQLDKELDENPAYLEWAKAVGLGEVTIKDSKGQNLTADFAKQAWYAHWDLPSPGMGYEFLHRFYPESRYGPSPWLRLAPKFIDKDLNDLLKANDYSPRFREHLAAVSMHPLTRVDIRRLHKDRIIDEKTVYHNFRAGGYDDVEATQMTKWVVKTSKDAELKPEKDGLKKRTCQAYQQGTIDRNGAEKTLILAGWTQDETNLQLELCDIDSFINIAKDGIGSIKAGFMSGVYTEKEARVELQTLGITDERIKQYLYLWRLKMASRRKVVAAKEVAGWFITDIIGMEEFVSRLTKLDYNAQDVTRIVQSTILEKATRIAKAQKQSYLEMQRQIEKNLRETERRRKEAERLARQREAELRRLQQEAAAAERNRLEHFLALRTEANLRKWLANGEITELEIRETFRIKGMNDADITRWLDTERQRGR